MTVRRRRADFDCQPLEPRETPAATSTLVGGVLTVTGSAGNERISVYAEGSDLLVLDGTATVTRVGSAAVQNIAVDGGGGNDSIQISNAVLQPSTITAGSGNSKLRAGGGSSVLTGGPGNDVLVGGLGQTSFNGGGGQNNFFRVEPTDIVFPGPNNKILMEAAVDNSAAPQATISAAEVDALLQRAAAASASNDAIIVITDRNGQILGVRAESGVAPEILNNTANLVYAVDGAYAKALTAAYFGNNQAPLTSRTVQNLSQSTMTTREVNSNPSITDPNSGQRGPGFVAPTGAGAHFPAGIAFTPQVDLYFIEHTNRDQTSAPGPDGIVGTADDMLRSERFNIDPAFVPAGNRLFVPDSYGRQSGLLPTAQSRGIGTLPGGIPLFKNGQAVGGIGVFFPGKTGFATEENSVLGTTYDPSKPDRTLEAEWIAFAAAGGTQLVTNLPGNLTVPVGELGGVPLPAGYGLPLGRIDLVGITLDVFGPGGNDGQKVLLGVSNAVGRGNPNDGTNLQVSPGGATLEDGNAVPTGWLVTPHDGVGITKADVERLIAQGIEQANLTRAAIRTPQGVRTKMVFAVTDKRGNVVGLFRQPDATVFSIDVAVAKARNVNYYADPTQLQPIDQLQNVPVGTAISNRTIRYLADVRFPEGIDGTPPGPFNQYNSFPPGTLDPLTGITVGPPLPASQFNGSVAGHDAFNPGTNFHQQQDLLNQNGIVFFPGSAPIYKTGPDGLAFLAGGFGVSGDGVDQDDVITFKGHIGYTVPQYLLQADEVFYRGVRLPYQKFNRNPNG